ncbi:conserved hypothetical protein [Desulfamplus magnetovallimortis]|uniref:CRISPR system ring nuclease SSO1393-like domain-containing protein n=1 Tax=Desulfamplus magnetovallimortis TaxID=1246637 RepID=A0A1W1H7G7_9BACT|nr:putative CRISPR-associated protein [Desulfamplus magnetovallimortis]SLM28430.1 conserved hypothetical protein [Desulfamplus magnetovallimortis]
MRDILISTAGTSLTNNINLLEDDNALKKTLASGNFNEVAELLCKLDENDRDCGAEINSVAAILSQQLLQQRFSHIILVSDTEKGTVVGEILKQYYTTRDNRQSRFSNVTVHRVEGLTSDDARLFKQHGLKNLVRLIGVTVRENSPERILINATGGYKAQISFAGMIGQALDIPVCYMFEGFKEVITLPPQPVSFDFEFWLRHYQLFCDLDQVLHKERKWDPGDERFHVLIDHVEIDGKHLYDLTPTGLLFHETFRSRFKSRSKDLLPAVSQIQKEDRKIVYEDANSGKHKGLKGYLEKIVSLPFVNSIYTHYYNPAIEKGNTFRKTRDGRVDFIDGTFSNNGAMTTFTIRTTAKTEQEWEAAIVYLSETIGI